MVRVKNYEAVCKFNIMPSIL